MRKNTSLNVNVNVVMISIALFTLFRFCSPVFINGTQLAPFYTLISKVVAAIIIGWYLFLHRRASVPFLIILCFFAIRFFVTFWYAPQNIMRVFMGAYPILALVCISEMLLNYNGAVREVPI